ncbi:hypothetical protein SAMN04487904_10592 [Actinopolyspora lacussalsi subsp. righensis]|uniref:Uncharacterized protein n=1 Tax=Actinopolyspora righensis TaxID=995060 RepID=A0A1I6ZR95_9ACTN|nr:hypothetical protein [Actinopolyspora righensis]SFT65238.1 hypothetical protein SAMN04487904_10592 [Actinopolyspora righensis]
MTTTQTHHYWLPVPDRTGYRWARHAFRGEQWDGRTTETSVCDVPCPMPQSSELDWVQSPTCQEYTRIPLAEQTT